MNAMVQDVSAVPRLEPDAWRRGVLVAVRAGCRPVTLFATRQGDAVTLTAVLADGGALRVTRAVVDAHQGYHALTADLPAFHCFEREVHEQTAVRMAGHPWLKPIRSERGGPMEAYPYYRIAGKEVHEVAVGPIHAGVIEPGSFRFACLGEQVLHLEIQLGYQHRGVERRLLEGDPKRLAPLVETIAGDSSVAHAWAYCAALESLAGVQAPLEIELARAVALELERVAMHLSGLAGLSADAGFSQGAAAYGRLRTTAINTTMALCGSRFGRGALRPGRAIPLSSDARAQALRNIRLLQNDLPAVHACFLEGPGVRHRLEGVGVVAPADAQALGLVGLAARASGVALDLRHPVSRGAYQAVPLAPQGLVTGDCWARARLRIAEVDASLDWLSRCLRRPPLGEVERMACGPLRANRLAIALVEGWRGEVVHCLQTGADGRLAHYKVQDPSLRNWMGLALAMRGNEISDFPLCNKSFDLSYCGNDL